MPARRAAAATRYAVRGQLVAVQLDTGHGLVKHESIPGYMDAMTMPFRVADRTAIRDRRPGDVTIATIVVEPEASHLENVQLAGSAPLDDAALARLVAEGLHILALGETAPATPLTTHRRTTVALPQTLGESLTDRRCVHRCPPARSRCAPSSPPRRRDRRESGSPLGSGPWSIVCAHRGPCSAG